MTSVRTFHTARDLADAERRKRNRQIVFVAILALGFGLFLGWSTAKWYAKAADCVPVSVRRVA